MSTQDANPYLAPKADLEVKVPTASAGSVEDAVAGRYDFTIGEVMDEAWRLTKGFKATFWGGAILAGVGFMVVGTVAGVVVKGLNTGEPNFVLSMIVNGLLGVAMAPVVLGMMMLGVRRAAGLRVSAGAVFEYMNRAGAAFLASLLTKLMTYLGLLLLIIPGLYLALGYMMAMPLVGDQNMSAWQAMETSRKALHHKWFRIFGLLFVTNLLAGISVLFLVVPIIWTGPWALMVYGVLYRRIFGGAPAGAATAPLPGPPPASALTR